MAKQISADRALALSFTPFKFSRVKTDKGGRAVKDEDGNTVYEIAETPRFIKPGETQASAIKRLKNNPLGRTKQSPVVHRFPTFTPGVTTTAQYVSQFESMNNLRLSGSAAHLTHPAPVEESPEVVVLDTCVEDLV